MLLTPLHNLWRQHDALVLLMGQSLFAGLAGAVMYAASNTLFLDQHGAGRIAHVYIAIAIVVSLVSLLFAVLQTRLSLSVLASGTYLLFVLIFFGSGWSVLFLEATWVSFALMVAFILLVQLFGIVIGAQAGRIYDVAQVKRLFPLVLAGQVVGLIAGGIAIAPLLNWLGGVGQLLLVSGLFMTLSLVFLGFTLQRFPGELHRKPPRKGRRPGVNLKGFLFRPFVMAIFIYQMLSAMGTKLVDFLFLERAEYFFPQPDQLAEFFGLTMAVGTILALVFLALVAGRLFTRFGMGMGLMFNPVAVALIMLVAIASGAVLGLDHQWFFWIIVAAAIGDYIFSIGMTDTAVNTSYQAIPAEQRASVQAAVQGVGVPLAFGLAGLLILLFDRIEQFGLHHVMVLCVVVIAAWSFAGHFAYRRYSRELESNLQRRMLDQVALEVKDASTLNVLESMLTEAKPVSAGLALDLLADTHRELHETWLHRFLEQKDHALLRLALNRITGSANPASTERIIKLMQQTDNDGVLADAARALGRVSSERAVETLPAYLEAGTDELRRAVYATLIQYGGDTGMNLVMPGLRNATKNQDSHQRVFAARVIGESACESFKPMLASLLRDPVAAVRKAAMDAASSIPDTSFLPEIFAGLEHQETRTSAMAALSAAAYLVIPGIGKLLSTDSPVDAYHLVRILRALQDQGDETLTKGLLNHLDHGQAEVRMQILRTLNHLDYWATAEQSELVQSALNDNYTCASELMQSIADLNSDDDTVTLVDALLHDLDNAAVEALFLASLMIEDGSVLTSVAARLTAGAREQRAILAETLEVTLPPALRVNLIPLVENTSIGSRLNKMTREFPSQPLPAGDRIHQLAWHGHPRLSRWTRFCALVADQARSGDNLGDNPARLRSPDRHDELVRITRQYSINPTGEIAGEFPEESAMLKVIERVAVLKSTDLFTDTPSHVLASLAAIIEEENLTAGTEFIRKNDTDTLMYIVVAGKVRVHDETTVIVDLGPGSVLGELAVLDEGRRSTSVTALEDSHVFSIDKPAFDEVMMDRPEITHAVIHMLCQRLRDTNLSMTGSRNS